MTSCAPARRISTPWATPSPSAMPSQNLPGLLPLAGPANKQGRCRRQTSAGRTSVTAARRAPPCSSCLILPLPPPASTNAPPGPPACHLMPYTSTRPAMPAYYPSTGLSLRVLFHTETGRILGAQLVGFEGVDKRCDVLAAAIRHGLTAYDLAELGSAMPRPIPLPRTR